MTRLADIEAHISGMGELLEIVNAMRSLAGMRMQEAQRTLPGIRRYAEAVAAGIADTLLLMGEPESLLRKVEGRLALVVCTAEHGFVGGFNERLIDAIGGLLTASDLLFVLGTRGAALARERKRPADWWHPMATRCAAAPETIQRVSTELYRRIAQGDVDRVEVVYARRWQEGETIAIERQLLLPLDLTMLKAKQARQPPLHNLSPIALHERLMAEHMFALLTEAAVESIASENATRLAAMASAHDNVSKKLDTLHRDAKQARQSEITAEILDLVAASKALGGEM